MVFGKLIKPLMVGCVALWAWTSSANAVLLSDVELVPGGASITDGLASVSLTSGAISFTGPAGVALGGSINPPVVGLLTTGSLLLTGPTITSGSFGSVETLGGLFLSGGFMDAVFGDGVLQVLFSVVGGSAAADFGDFVVLSLANPTLGPDTPNNLPLPPNIETISATLTIDSARVVQLSVPAVLGLFLPGVGLLLLLTGLRRRVGWSGSQIC